MKKYAYMLAIALCLGLIACGDDKEDNVVSPATNNTQQGNTSQSLPDPEGTVIARITNDGNFKNGICIQGYYLYLDGVNNLCINPDGVPNVVKSYTKCIANIGKVKGLSAVTKIPTEGFGDKVATTEGDGFVIRGYTMTGYSIEYGYSYGYIVISRMYLASYIRDALGNIIGATIKYQTGSDWVENEE